MEHTTTKTIYLPSHVRETLEKIKVKSVSNTLRALLQDYVDGRTIIELAEPEKDDIRPTSILLKPSLLDQAIEKAKADGLTFTKLIVELITRSAEDSKSK